MVVRLALSEARVSQNFRPGWIDSQGPVIDKEDKELIRDMIQG